MTCEFNIYTHYCDLSENFCLHRGPIHLCPTYKAEKGDTMAPSDEGDMITGQNRKHGQGNQ